MKPPLIALGLIALAGLATPALADTRTTLLTRCTQDTPTPDVSDDCVQVRHDYRNRLRDCMAKLAATSQTNPAANGANSAVGMRARFRICSAQVRDTFAGANP